MEFVLTRPWRWINWITFCSYDIVLYIATQDGRIVAGVSNIRSVTGTWRRRDPMEKVGQPFYEHHDRPGYRRRHPSEGAPAALRW